MLAVPKTGQSPFPSEYVAFTQQQRLRRACRWWSAFLVCCVVVWTLQYRSDQLREYWWYVWPFLLFAVIGVRRYLQRGERVLTPEGVEAKRVAEEKQRLKKERFGSLLDRLLKKRIVRYPAAAAFIWLAYEWGQDPNKKPVHVIMMLLLAAMAAWDLILWLLLAGIAVGVVVFVFKGVAALPISVA